MKVSPFLFILIKDGRFILWDYKLHNQFEVTVEYLDELIRIGAKLTPLNRKVFSELVENNIIVSEDDNEYSDSAWEWDDLAKIFHIGTQDISDEVISPADYACEYLEDCEKKYSKISILEYKREGERIDLPHATVPEIENAKFMATLYGRRTSRNFNSTSISLKSVATLLKITFGTLDRDQECYNSLGLMRIGQRKTSPSGGGLHPSEAYLYAKNIDGLEKGIYHFNSKENFLTKVEIIKDELNLGNILNGQYFANDLSAGVFITSVFKKQWWKYKHSRAYRIALLDIGHLSQTFLLSATALGLSTWVSGAFNDTKVSKLLRLDSICERPIFFIGLGNGNNSSIDPETLKILEKECHAYSTADK